MQCCKKASIILLALLVAILVVQPNRVHASVYIEPALYATLATSSGPVEALVNYDPLVTTGPALATAVQELGAGTITFQHLDTLAVRATPDQFNQVSALPGVSGLYANQRIQYLAQPAVLEYIGVDRVWEQLGYTGAGIGIAIIDSGIDTTHPDLAYGTKTMQNVAVVADPDNVYHFKGRPGRTLFLEDQRNTDYVGHGSSVAGLAAGNGAASDGLFLGVARDAHLLGISLGLDPNQTFTLSGMAAFDYVLKHAAEYNIKAANIAFGSGADGSTNYDPDHPVNRATKKLHDYGITVAVSVGNSGAGADGRGDTMNVYSMTPWVIGVAAGCVSPYLVRCSKDEFEQGIKLLANFSSRGVPGHPQFHPTLTAPGASIVIPSVPSIIAPIVVIDIEDPRCGNDLRLQFPTYAPRYACYFGTSWAAPQVAGTVALMQQAAGARLPPDQIKDILVRTARPMYKDDGIRYEAWEAGAGYLDVYAAVRAARR